MLVPLIQKNGPGDDDACQAICLAMALQSYAEKNHERIVSKEEVYDQCECVGNGHLALPWGTCKATALNKRYILHISNNPRVLNDYNEIMQKCNKTYEQANEYVNSLIQFCESSEYIQLVRWQEGDSDFLFDVIKRGYGIIFPTLRWNGTTNHSVVVTDIVDGIVKFNNPNRDDKLEFSIEEFLHRWSQPETDNDFFIVSEKPINVNECRKRITLQRILKPHHETLKRLS